MAIEMNTRTKILAGVVVLAAAGAGAWFFLFQDDAPPPRPAAVAKPAATPPADASKAAAAGEPAKAGGGPKPAVAAAKPAGAVQAKPVPTDPDQVVAEFLDTSGARATLQQVASDVMKGSGTFKDPAAAKEFENALQRAFEPNALVAEVANNLKAAYDADRMPRYLELMRDPIAQKMAALRQEASALSREEMQTQMDAIEKNPLPEARAKLLARVEELRRNAGLGSEIGQTMGKGYVEGVLEYLQGSKNGKTALTQIGGGDPRNARAALQSKAVGGRAARIKASVTRLAVTYRTASDAEISEYLKLIDTEIGEWGAKALAAAVAPAMEKRGREQGKAFAQFSIDGIKGTAKAPVAPSPAPLAKAQPKSASEAAPLAKPAALPSAPVEAPGYRRAANIRDLYSRYNDVISATVMRDRTGVQELLDDGKSPNHRQSDGLTPLMVAASNGDTDIVALLLSKGADPTLRAGGRSALSIARARGSVGAGSVQLLERTGVRD